MVQHELREQPPELRIAVVQRGRNEQVALWEPHDDATGDGELGDEIAADLRQQDPRRVPAVAGFGRDDSPLALHLVAPRRAGGPCLEVGPGSIRTWLL
jgi:hypothetical protein